MRYLGDTQTAYRRALGVSLGFIALLAGGCGDDAPVAGPDSDRACVDLGGTWTSGEYEALAVQADGTHSTISGLTMTLEIVQQPSCQFRAVNTWSNGTIGGTENVAGVVHNDGTLVTMLEVADHPEGGSTGRILARFEAGRLEWEYAGLAGDGSRAIMFGTILSRDAAPPPAADCPDILGTWFSGTYEALTVQADGSHQLLTGLSMSLDVQHQAGCGFRGVNTWSNSEIGGSEPIAGLIHADGNTLTMVELGTHPEGGSTGRIFGRLGEDRLEWEYAGLDVPRNRAVVFSTILARTQPLPERGACADMLGTWISGTYSALAVDTGGSLSTLENLEMTLRIEHQSDCHFRGINEWGNGEIGGAEPVAGLLHADGVTVTMVEVGSHPDGGSSAIIIGKLTGEGHLEWEYGGLSESGHRAIVFSTTLIR